MPRQVIPHFSQVPEGFAPVRKHLLPGVTALDAVRSANACKYEASRLRLQLARGAVPDIHVRRAEEQIVSLMLMERTLAALCGALRAAEREDARASSAAPAEAPHAA